MLEFIKKQTIASWLVCAGAVLGLIGVIIFLVNSTSGYFAGQVVNAWIPLSSFIAVILAVCVIIFYEKIKSFADIGVMVAVILLGISVALFIYIRIDIFSNVWFIPIPNSEIEITSTNVALTGIIFYLISIISLITASFFKKLGKEKA